VKLITKPKLFEINVFFARHVLIVVILKVFSQIAATLIIVIRVIDHYGGFNCNS